MSDNINVLLVGTGYMGIEYCKVLLAQDIKPIVVGRSKGRCDEFAAKTGIQAEAGGIGLYLENHPAPPEFAIVAVDIDCLAPTATLLIDYGVKYILLEKPGGMNRDEISELALKADQNDAVIYIAYNRRFYASTRKAIDIIKEDGGVSSFNFEFTEWSSDIEKLNFPQPIKDIWLLANSTHVIDLAFFLGGFPKEISPYVSGSLPWHKCGCIYAGAGITVDNTLFSYQANWSAPGRWSVEILTKYHRLYFKPMEQLHIQRTNSVNVEKYELDDRLDVEFKPGLYLQVKSFMDHATEEGLLTVREHVKFLDMYEKISGIK